MAMANRPTDHRRYAISHQPPAMAAIAIGLALCAQPSVRTQARRPMSLIDLAELPRALNPQLSPDGKTVIYHQSHADWKADRPIWNVWRQDIGGAPRQITFSESGETNGPGDLRWSPDGKTIFFIRTGQIWLMPVDGGEPSALT